jgi:predicted site-specific integrase-resolvase
MRLPKLYTARELASTLGMPYESLLEWTRSGDVPALRIQGRYYYKLAEVVDTLAKVEAELGLHRPGVPDGTEALTC